MREQVILSLILLLLGSSSSLGDSSLVSYPEGYRTWTHVKSMVIQQGHPLHGSFGGIHHGAMPPFGNLYGMDVYVAASLAESEEIVFNAGSHLELIRLAYRDFWRLVRAKVLVFSRKGK